jgi:hypothetical protein
VPLEIVTTLHYVRILGRRILDVATKPVSQLGKPVEGQQPIQKYCYSVAKQCQNDQKKNDIIADCRHTQYLLRQVGISAENSVRKENLSFAKSFN